MKTTLEYHLLLLLLFLSRLLLSSSRECPPFSCGIFTELGFPFSEISNPECGLAFMNCTGDPQIQFSAKGKWYQVDSFNNLDQSIHIRDPDVQRRLDSNHCDLLSNFTEKGSPFLDMNIIGTRPFFKCKRSPPYPNSPSFFKSFGNHSCIDYDLYFYPDDQGKHLPALPQTLSTPCSVVMSSRLYIVNNNTFFFGSDFAIAWEVHHLCWECHGKGGQCLGSPKQSFECANSTEDSVRRNDSIGDNVLPVVVAGAILALVGPVVLVLVCAVVVALFWKRLCSSISIIFWKRQNNSQILVQDFLQNYGSLLPQRYSYYDLKKITSSFKDKIGQGGYGKVYKGTLLDGRLVAVKLLNNGKGTGGQEFINEVSSISKTSHVNVVCLLGFCIDRSKRALIYEFMANGSLEKFIFGRNPLETQAHLGWETFYRVAIGVARGLEYLHRGCNTRILHFDIKPHNILLDVDFTPKISDFGLAKLCPRNDSIISMMDARGTVGYIAPEVFSRLFGGVSHKSDVYSYGMMVLAVIGEKKNVDVQVNHTSEKYFPEWIYERLEQGEDLGLNGIMSADEGEKARKMMLVALWCIQTNPKDRPTMTRVVEMLEGTHESLLLPPKPYLASPPRFPRSSVSSSTT